MWDITACWAVAALPTFQSTTGFSEAASFSATEIRRVLAFGIREFPGVTGIIQFNDYGDVRHNPIMFIVKDGQVLNYERYIAEERIKITEKIKKLLKG